MIGRATAGLQTGFRRLVYHVLGCPCPHTRQKWAIVWPVLSTFSRGFLRVLDAGCGAGLWTLEIAKRRPMWELVGVDRNPECIEKAETARARLGVVNARFECADLLEWSEMHSFDVIVSVMSAHYAASRGEGLRLFAKFAEFSRNGGHLVALATRSKSETPQVACLPTVATWDVFATGELELLCKQTGWDVVQIQGRIGELGTVSKQVAVALEHRRQEIGRLLRPMLWVLMSMDAGKPRPCSAPSLMWLLVARRR